MIEMDNMCEKPKYRVGERMYDSKKLPNQINVWRQDLQKLWHTPNDMENQTEIFRSIYNYLADSVFNTPGLDIYSIAMTLAESYSDYSLHKPNTLSLSIIRMLNKYINNLSPDDLKIVEENLSSENQFRAFDLATRKHCVGFDQYAMTFNLYEVRENFIPLLHERLFVTGRFHEAATIICKWRLHDMFDPMPILLMLIIEDRLPQITFYINGDRQLGERLVTHLDKYYELLNDRSNFTSFINNAVPEFYENPSALYNKVSSQKGKQLGKIITKLLKDMKIDASIAVNFINLRALNHIRYLFYSRYKDDKISDQALEDIMMRAAKERPDIIDQLIVTCMQYDMRLTARFILEIDPQGKLPASIVPTQLRRLVKLESNKRQNTEDEDDIRDPQFHQLPPTIEESIRVVATQQDLNSMCQEVQGADMLGMDAEFSFEYGAMMNETVALFQIASRSACYLIDVPTLLDTVDDQVWQHFFNTIFENEKILKLGFSMQSDIRMLMETVPVLKNHLHKIKNTACIKRIISKIVDLTEKIQADDIQEMKTKPQMQTSSFSAKQQQMSFLHNKNAKFAIFASANFAGKPSTSKNEKEEQVLAKDIGLKLSDLCEHFLYRPLNKRQCLSDWLCRPLRKAQIRYAALDAFCLIEIFDAIRLLFNDDIMFNGMLKSSSQEFCQAYQKHSPNVNFSKQTMKKGRKITLNVKKRQEFESSK